MTTMIPDSIPTTDRLLAYTRSAMFQAVNNSHTWAHHPSYTDKTTVLRSFAKGNALLAAAWNVTGQQAAGVRLADFASEALGIDAEEFWRLEATVEQARNAEGRQLIPLALRALYAAPGTRSHLRAT